MAQVGSAQLNPVSAQDPQATQHSLWRRWFGQANGEAAVGESPQDAQDSQEPRQDEDEPQPGIIRRVSRKVVPGLPRAQTFKRQQAEVRKNLEPVQPTQAERRAVSVDRRMHTSTVAPSLSSNPRTSAPDFMRSDVFSATVSAPSLAGSVYEEKMLDSIGELAMSDGGVDELPRPPGTAYFDDTASMTTSQYDTMIHDELERIWILNLSMHFRDKSKREKFFVTYREKEQHWRRVTISLDYRGAPDNSLEMDLLQTRFQRDKSAKIYEAIRESLVDIQFYETVTNLKLQTTDGRLHVHVVEDVNEIIHYPASRMIQHLMCRHVRESDIEFEAHMSGFVYKVRVNGQILIKKEIPGPDTIDEFLYEINALSQLRDSNNVIQFYGVIVDDYGEHVKGLLISYAEQGALIDVIYDHDHSLPWHRRQKWARQIVEGLSEVHEAGFVQGDFTLSNIVIDHNDNAKIIDCNRRGCPVGWEPPEATPLIDSNQRISMYIGVKSDLYQLGMVLWALAEQEDEPENHRRPLTLSEGLDLPDWYMRVVRTCLADNPRDRMQAIDLLRLFPPRPEADVDVSHGMQPSISVDDGLEVHEFLVNEYQTGDGPIIKTVQAPSDWSPRNSFGHTYVDSPTALSSEPYYYPTRGRSPPSPMPSNMEYCDPRWSYQGAPWANARGRSFERTRSSSGLYFALNKLAPDAGEASVTPQMQGEIFQLDDTAEQKPIAQQRMEGDDVAMPRQEEQLTVAQEGEEPSETTIEDAGQIAEEAKVHRDDRNGKGQSRHLEPTAQVNEDQGNTDTQHIASRSNGVGVHDFLPSENNTTATRTTPTPSSAPPPSQNPLFQEAGTTEPEAPRTVALVSRAAKVQKSKSTSAILDTRQAQEAERVDSAVEMSLSPSAATYPLESGRRWLHTDLAAHISFPAAAGTNVPDSLLLCLGAGHGQSSDDRDEGLCKEGTNTIADDDLVEA